MKDPDEHVISYGSKHPSGCDGYLDVDNTSGYGPENIFFPKDHAPVGTYKVRVNNYGGMSNAGYTLFIYAKGKTKTYSGTFTSSTGNNAYFEFDLQGHFSENAEAW